MLPDCMEIFKEIYAKKDIQLILEDYILEEGDYILINTLGKIEKKITVDNIINDYNSQDYNYFKKYDYLSKLLSIQKSIDPKKVIHSNNYLTFFIKKENINNGKLKDEIIDKYYEILKNPLIKYTNPQEKELYEKVEEKCGKADEKFIDKIKLWIKSNIHNLVEKDNKEKSYLKIFFKCDEDRYKKESEKYILPNIYNNNKK